MMYFNEGKIKSVYLKNNSLKKTPKKQKQVQQVDVILHQMSIQDNGF